MKIDKPLILPIVKIVKENDRVKSFYFKYHLDAEPGQFVMIWVSCYDEKPFGVIVKDKNTFSISVASVGPTSNHLHKLKVGDNIGIRGPYGTFFHLPLKKSRIALIGGGYGMVPLSYLAMVAKEKGHEVDLYIGARSKNDLLIYSWLKKYLDNVFISTDDGSKGMKGYIPDLFKHNLRKYKPNKAYIVGPEIMEVKTSDICYRNKISFEVSLDRYIKCGFGICGQCCVDEIGWRMCVEGPIVDQTKLKKIIEFGKYKRNASGKIIKY